MRLFLSIIFMSLALVACGDDPDDSDDNLVEDNAPAGEALPPKEVESDPTPVTGTGVEPEAEPEDVEKTD